MNVSQYLKTQSENQAQEQFFKDNPRYYDDYLYQQELAKTKKEKKIFDKPSDIFRKIAGGSAFAGANLDNWRGFQVGQAYNDRGENSVIQSERDFKWLLAVVAPCVPYTSTTFQDYDLEDQKWRSLKSLGMNCINTGAIRQHVRGQRILGFCRGGKATSTAIIRVKDDLGGSKTLQVIQRIHNQIPQNIGKDSNINRPSMVVKQNMGYTHDKNSGQEPGFRIYYCFDEYIKSSTLHNTFEYAIADIIEKSLGTIDIIPNDSVDMEPMPFNLNSQLVGPGGIGIKNYGGLTPMEQIHEARKDFVLHKNLESVIPFIRVRPNRKKHQGSIPVFGESHLYIDKYVPPQPEAPKPVMAPKLLSQPKMFRNRETDAERYRIDWSHYLYKRAGRAPSQELLCQVEKYVTESPIFRDFKVSKSEVSDSRDKLNCMRVFMHMFAHFYDAHRKNPEGTYYLSTARIKDVVGKRYAAPFNKVFVPLMTSMDINYSNSKYNSHCRGYNLSRFGEILGYIKARYKIPDWNIKESISFDDSILGHKTSATLLEEDRRHPWRIYIPHIYREYVILKNNKRRRKIRGRLGSYINQFRDWFKIKQRQTVPVSKAIA